MQSAVRRVAHGRGEADATIVREGVGFYLYALRKRGSVTLAEYLKEISKDGALMVTPFIKPITGVVTMMIITVLMFRFDPVRDSIYTHPCGCGCGSDSCARPCTKGIECHGWVGMDQDPDDWDDTGV